MRIITGRMKLLTIFLMVCTDSYSLYEYLVKLGTTTEKRLIIDIINLRELYKNREIIDIRWINSADNPADAMTKASPNKALETLISTNKLTIRIEGWVQRKEMDRTYGQDKVHGSSRDGGKRDNVVL